MTLTIKDSPELNSPGKPGGLQSPRSNPVCLEVVVTVRSLPGESGNPTQPIREEARTVIVFDNGAVLRTISNLPVGQTVIVSNPNGRDVVCRVVGGRNLPNLKGYAEVEFVEPVSDFWGIHQEADRGGVPAPPVVPVAAPSAAFPSPAVPLTPRSATPPDSPAKAGNPLAGGGPTFEDISRILNMRPAAGTREPKPEPARPAAEKLTKKTPVYSQNEIAKPTPVANWLPPNAEQPPANNAIPALEPAPASTSPSGALSRDFMSKGLMAYEQPSSTRAASNQRTPLIVGAAALALVAIFTVVFLMRRSTTPVPAVPAAATNQPVTAQPPAATSPSESVRTQRDQASQASQATPSELPNQPSAQPSPPDQAQPSASMAAVPAAVKGPANSDSGIDSQNLRRQEKNAVVTNQPDVASSRRPVIPNLKLSAPVAPKPKLASPGEGSAPVTDVASTAMVGGLQPGGLLTSAGRASAPPAPPAAAAPAPVSAAGTSRDPKLISSTRLVYPSAAKESNVQGTVQLTISIDAAGNVVGATAQSGPMILRQAAVESVRQWKYSPALVNGKSSPSQVIVRVEFKLN